MTLAELKEASFRLTADILNNKKDQIISRIKTSSNKG